MSNFEHQPTYKQSLALEILYDEITKYICFGGGAGGGKSWIGCEWLTALSLTFPDTKYFIARREKARLKESTLKTFFKVCKFHGIVRDRDYIYQDQKGVITFHNESEILLLDVKKQPSDPLFEDLGSLEFTSGFGEEVSEWDFDAFDTLRTRIGRWNNDKYGIPPKFFLTCNPKKNWVYHTFYKPHKEGKLETSYAFIQSLINDNPKADKEYINTLHDIKDVNKKQRLLYGNWEYDDDPSALCDYNSISSIFTNEHVEYGQKCITCDVARFGEDKAIIRVWAGFRVLKRLEFDISSVTQVADYVKECCKEFKIPMHKVLVDEDGVGGGVVDILGCQGFVANSRPFKNENYDNLKSQCAFAIAEAINENLIYEKSGPTLQQRITEELEQLKHKNMNDDKKNGVIPKDKIKEYIGRSPDDLDTYIMRGWFIKNTFTGIARGRRVTPKLRPHPIRHT